MTSAATWTTTVSRWTHCLGSDTPDLGFIDPMLRRRLSPMARAVLHVANVCVHDRPSVSFVFSSRHGELQRTVEMLGNLARREDLSPTLFSLSVLNSSAGIFSIARKDHAPSSAISAGRESFGYGLLEAHLRSQANAERPVVYIYADAPAPEPLGRQPGDPQSVFALGLLIGAGGEMRLQTQIKLASEIDTTAYPQSYACLQTLEGHNSIWSSGHHQWHWNLQ